MVFGPVTLEHWSEYGFAERIATDSRTARFLGPLGDWGLPQTGAPLWRKQAILDVGGWKHDQPCCQEHELYLRLLIGEKRFAYHPTNGAVYRQWSTETVCRRDISEVHRRRLEIEQRLENHLRENMQLTWDGCARSIRRVLRLRESPGNTTRISPAEIMDQVRRLDPKFSPTGAAAPAHYRLVFRSLGFQAAEGLAAVARRRIRRSTSCLGCNLYP